MIEKNQNQKEDAASQLYKALLEADSPKSMRAKI